MQLLTMGVILALFLSVCAFSGCVGSSVNSNANVRGSDPAVEDPDAARTNIEELHLLISIPFEIEGEDIIWKEDAAERKLTAVLRFASTDANKLVEEAAAIQAPEAVTISSEPWFPSELIAIGEMSGDDSLKGVAYAGDVFFQEPYTSGRVIRIDGTDYFVLELSAK